MTGQVQRQPTAAKQRLRQSAIARAEQQRLQPRTAALAFDERADRRAFPPDPVGAHHPGALQHQDRLLVARAERRQAREMLRQFGRRARHRQRALHRQVGGARQRRGGGQAFIQERRESPASAPGRSENPAAIGWPPPVFRMPACRAAITAAPRSWPATERPDPFRHTVRNPGDAGRAVEALLDPAGDDADHAGMPRRRR